jgi:hypothetical protein
MVSFNRARNIPIEAVITTIGTEEYRLAQQYVFKLIKPGYMFQLHSQYQAYLQSLVELHMLNAYAYIAYAFNIYSLISDCTRR